MRMMGERREVPRWQETATNSLSDKNSSKITRGRGEMNRWKCTLCDYVYDPAIGDEDAGIAPGTAFEDLPDDWVCPTCGAEKDMFEKIVA
jgi:rubredoxin